jgi:peptide/nickel transport system substrate-binding protein
MRTHLARTGRLTAVAATLLASVTLAACGGDSESSDSTSTAAADTGATTTAAAGGETRGASGSTIVVADATSPTALDPDGTAGIVVQNQTVISNAYAGLVDYKQSPNDEADGGGIFLEGGEVEPRLAESWTNRGDVWTFRLRRDARSSAGNPFTSADVVWTFRRNMALRSNGTFILTALMKVRDVVADGRYSVRFVTDGPSPMLLNTILTNSVRPIDSVEAMKHATREDPWASRWLNRNTAGFGAYVAEDFQSGQSVTLRPQPGYYGEAPQKAVNLIAIADPSSRYAALQQGDIGVALGLTPEQVEQASGDGALHVYKFRGNGQISLFPNWRDEILENPQIRQALWYATPLDDIIESVYKGTAFPTSSILPSYVNGYTDAYNPYTYDPERARDLLAEGGHPDGFDTELFYASDSTTLGRLATLLQAAWEQVGVRVRLNSQPSTSLVTRAFSNRDLTLYLTDTSSPEVPDGSILGALWSSSGFANTQNYANPRFDAAYERSLSTLDADERDAAIDEMQRESMENPLMIPIAGLYGIAVTQSGIRDWRWMPTQAQDFMNLTTE